ncbi:hypothetical protein RND81_11G209400 [Saponaria officinalis]|uniref:Uncharacterized protein n=1 Tax=Saponaria officinalis TaxID=3572 RepID=A0AAW1HQD5_SAPOF
MAMFRAMSSTKGRRGGYDKLLDESNDNPSVNNQDNAVLKRAISVPARVLFGSSTRKLNSSSSSETSSPANNSKTKKKSEKVHPVFSLFDGKSWKKKKKLTANPDFSRYIEYLKEGGVWNKDTNNSPVIQ